MKIAAYSGMRANEIVQLSSDDIKQVDGLWCIDINNPKEWLSLKIPAVGGLSLCIRSLSHLFSMLNPEREGCSPSLSTAKGHALSTSLSGLAPSRKEKAYLSFTLCGIMWLQPLKLLVSLFNIQLLCLAIVTGILPMTNTAKGKSQKA